jgi:small-conductance mechanosensitive channel
MVASMLAGTDTVHFAAITSVARGLITAGSIVVFAFFVGLVVDRVVIGGIRKLAQSTPGKMDDIIIGSLSGVARWAFVLAGLYFALPFLPLPGHIDHEVTVGTRIAVMALAIFVAARFASGIAAHYAHRILPSSVSLAKIIVNAVVFSIGILVIFQTMGIQITPVITALGVGGLAVALALQDTLANFFAGIQMLALKQMNPGNFVTLDTEQSGYIVDIGWRNTTMRMVTNNIVIVPNTKLSQAIVTNYSLENPAFSVRLAVGVAYDSDLEKVERVSIEVAREVIARVEGTVRDFDPLVRFNAFADSSINFNIVVRCEDYGHQFLLAHELIKALHRRFGAEGIEIPFPIRTVVMKPPRA